LPTNANSPERLVVSGRHPPRVRVLEPVEHRVDRHLRESGAAEATADGCPGASGCVERVDEVTTPGAEVSPAESAVDKGPVDDVPGLEEDALDGEDVGVGGDDGEAV